MRCPACGQDSADQKRFCGSCGIPLPISSVPLTLTPEASEPSPPPRKPLLQESESSPPLSSQPAPLSFGNGRYQVVRILGEGGSKIVYLARDSLLDREVALALIKIGNFDEQEKARITREAQAMAKLGDHPNIVTIHDVGEDAGRPYIVTQYMAGGSIDDLLRRSPHHHLPTDDAVRIGGEICQALEYAHAHGVVHRDLKPGNVWLTKQGTSKLGDFGLALAAGQPRLTDTGLVAGTVAYMAPEQVMGKPIDMRSDLYSLGAMLYEMVTGRPPFLGDNIATVIAQLLNSEPLRPSQLLPDVPASLDRLILKLLAKTPDRRFSSAAEVRHELAALDQGIDHSETGVAKGEDIASTVARDLSQLNLHEAPDGTVSLFFSDIEGSTAIWERLGDLKAIEVLHDHDSIVHKQVESHQGFVVNTTGDGFFVTFKTVRQALLCAIDIQRDLVTYGQSHPDHPIRLRIGLHIGEATRESNEYHGNSVNFAARVMAHANGGEIATSATFMDLAKDAGDIRFDHGREVTMKGFPDTYRIYRVAWNLTSDGDWLCPNCARTIPAAQRLCLACTEASKPTPTQAAIAAATLSPIPAVSTPIPVAVAAASPLSRVLGVSALVALIAAASFAGLYLYNNRAAAKHLPGENLASVHAAPHSGIAPKPESNLADVASLSFTSMSLDPCGKPLPIAVYTKQVLSAAGCLKWSAGFGHYTDGLQKAANALEVTIYDPHDQAVTQGASDSVSGDSQSGGHFFGTASIPDLTAYSIGAYMMVLSAGDNEVAERPFYVVDNHAFENIDLGNIDRWTRDWSRDHPGEPVPMKEAVVESQPRRFVLHSYHREQLYAGQGSFDRILSESRPRRSPEREAASTFKEPPPEIDDVPYEPASTPDLAVAVDAAEGLRDSHGVWRTADYWHERHPDWVYRFHPEWAVDRQEWWLADHRIHPEWFESPYWRRYPVWTYGTYDRSHVWRDAGWWRARDPAWFYAHHPEWAEAHPGWIREDHSRHPQWFHSSYWSEHPRDWNRPSEEYHRELSRNLEFQRFHPSVTAYANSRENYREGLSVSQHRYSAAGQYHPPTSQYHPPATQYRAPATHYHPPALSLTLHPTVSASSVTHSAGGGHVGKR